MTTETKTLPENLSVNVIAKWLEGNQIKLRVRAANSLNKTERTFDYSGGLLAFLPRERTEKEIPDTSKRFHVNQIRRFKAAEIKKSINHKGKTLYDEDMRNSGKQAALQYLDLDPIEFFYSLIRNTEDGEMRFADFCSDFGYEEDIRKAHSVWEKCGEIGRDVRNILGKQFAEIHELVQDY